MGFFSIRGLYVPEKERNAPIRSHMRVRKKKWAAGELEGNPLILRDASQYKKKVSETFTNPDLALHLEIGCGKGRFVTETSKANKTVNHIAIERDPTILAAAARYAKENGAGNVRFLVGDAVELPDYFEPGQISRLYINFCDPWPTKKKRARRRLTHDRFLEIYGSLLIPEIFFKTDNRVLFEFSLESFPRCGWLPRNISLDLHNSDFFENIVTEYEEKFSKHGPIYRLEAYRHCV